MPPKVAKNAEDGDPNFKFVFSVLKYCDSVKPSWENVAKEIGIGYGKNAQAKFKTLVEKHGFKFEAGRILTPDEDGSTAAATDSPGAKTVTKTPKTPRTPRTPKTAGSKRKAAEANGDDVDDTPTKPTKKKKAPKSEVVIKDEVKDEVKDEETNGEVKDEEINGEVKEDIEAESTKGESKDEDDLDAELDLTPQQVADMIP